jgi:tetratricopeptide (TPR) repeat protein
MVSVGAALDEVGRLDDAEKLLSDAVGRCRRTLGLEDPTTLEAQSLLGEALQTLGRYEEAEPLLREALEAQRRVFPQGEEQFITMSSLAACLREQGRLTEAEALAKEFADLAPQVMGPTHVATMTAMNSLGNVLTRLEKWEEAADVQAELLAIGQKTLPPDHWYIGLFHGNLGESLWRLGRNAQAEPHLIAGYERSKASLGEDRNLTERRLDRLYRFYYQTGPLDDAQRLHREAVRMRLRVAGAGEFPSVLRSIDEYFEFAETHGAPVDADTFYRGLVDYAQKTLPVDHPLRPHYCGNLGRALVKKEQFALAEPLLLSAFQQWKNRQGDRGPDVKLMLDALIDLYTQTDRPEKASEIQAVLASATKNPNGPP